MDPYLESPEIFPDLHDSMITYIREALQASLPEPYFAALGRRVWIEVSRRSVGPGVEFRRPRGHTTPGLEPAVRAGIASSVAARPVVVKVPHDEFREPFVEVYTRGGDGKRLVTSIEILSLSNKTPGEQGRDLYRRKQKELLGSKVQLVEIDLLRDGDHTTAVPTDLAVDACGPFDYHICVHCFDDPETFLVYPNCLEERLPPIDVPLLPGDPSVTLDLQSVFERCYDAGPYRREIRYGEDQLIPPLPPGREGWLTQVLQGEAD
jgi:hypothetical protein